MKMDNKLGVIVIGAGIIGCAVAYELARSGRRVVCMAYMSGRVLRACPDLRTIAYLSTGLATHGDVDEAARLGIRFEGVKGYGDRAVAEHAIALAFAALRAEKPDP